MMKIPILAFGPGVVGWRKAATARLLIVMTRVVIGNSWASDVHSHPRLKRMAMANVDNNRCIFGRIFGSPYRYFTMSIGEREACPILFSNAAIDFPYGGCAKLG